MYAMEHTFSMYPHKSIQVLTESDLYKAHIQYAFFPSPQAALKQFAVPAGISERFRLIWYIRQVQSSDLRWQPGR